MKSILSAMLVAGLVTPAVVEERNLSEPGPAVGQRVTAIMPTCFAFRSKLAFMRSRRLMACSYRLTSLV